MREIPQNQERSTTWRMTYDGFLKLTELARRDGNMLRLEFAFANPQIVEVTVYYAVMDLSHQLGSVHHKIETSVKEFDPAARPGKA
jgi:YD repeat-containing protein